MSDSTTAASVAGGNLAFAALRSMAVRYWGRFLFSTVIRAAAAALLALHPYFLAEMATSVDDPDRVARNLALLLITGAAHWVLWSVADFYISRRVFPLTWDFKRLAFDTVWADDYRHFVDRPSGKVASYVNDVRDHTQSLFESLHFGFLPVLAMLPVYVVLLVRTAPGSAAVYAVFLIGAAVVLAVTVKPVNDRQRRLTDNTATNNGRVFDSYANFVNVFAFRAQKKERARNDQQIDGLIDDQVRFYLAVSTYWTAAAAMIRILLWAAMLGFGWYQFDQGRITLAALVVSTTVLLDFTAQYWEVVHHFGMWIDKSAAYREAYHYLFPGRDIVAEAGPGPLPTAGPGQDLAAASTPAVTVRESSKAAPDDRLRLVERLSMENVSFAYPDEPDRLVLDNVGFDLARGERLGIVGRSGEGKSTLVKLLLGFYAPTAGRIMVDGRPVAAGDLNRLQAYVPQDTSLFQETIEYNIGYAEPGPVDPIRIRDAAAKAHIAEFIEALPRGYSTMVGERGIKLSLGQRQRIAIARAFLADADLVILDEATSALDSETEGHIQAALSQLWAGRAAIVIAHRLATLNDVDRILVIEKGRVAEQGTKDELLAAGGLFADLWGLQKAGLL